MIINLGELALKRTTLSIRETLDVTSLIEDQPDILKIQPLEVHLEATRTPNAVNVQGELSTELSLICSRCLSHYDESLSIPFHEVFTDLPVSSEMDDNVHLINEDKVDVLPYIEENVIVSLPFITVCSPSCKGLCPHCGINLNAEGCQCKEEMINPRMEGLKDFLF